MTLPETSIIIRTFNEGKHLPSLYESLDRQRYRDFEIVVIDSGSLDRSREISGRWAQKMLRINSQDFTFGYSLNLGIEAARGKFAAIISAHTLPTSDDWLGTLIEPLRQESIAMSYGRQLGWPTSKFSEAKDLRRTFGPKYRVQGPPHYFAHNGNSAVRIDLWGEHPFDEVLTGLEDIEWARHWMQRGYRVVYQPDAAVHHIHEEQWKQIRNRYYRESLAARRMGIKSRRHIPLELAREIGYTISDLGAAVWPFGDHEGVELKNFVERSRQVLKFRTQKTAGTLVGILDGAAMDDPATRRSVFFDRTCRGLVIRGPGRASIEDVPIQEVKPGDVMVRVAYNGICGKDLALADGSSGQHQGGIDGYPIVPGHEISGRVAARGANISHLQEGDPVVVECIQGCGACRECRACNHSACAERVEIGLIGRNGGCSEYIVVPGRLVHKVPDGMDLARAALCEPLAVVLKGVKRLSMNWPAGPAVKHCAVLGAGSMGHLCAKVLAGQGHRVTVYDQDPARQSYLKDVDVELVSSLDSLWDFEILVEATGDPDVLNTVLEDSAAGTSILLLGLPHSYKEFTFERIVTHDKAVIGSVGSGPSDFAEAIKLLPNLNLGALLESIVPLEDYQEAWDMFKQRKHLKTLLKIE